MDGVEQRLAAFALQCEAGDIAGARATYRRWGAAVRARAFGVLRRHAAFMSVAGTDDKDFEGLCETDARFVHCACVGDVHGAHSLLQSCSTRAHSLALVSAARGGHAPFMRWLLRRVPVDTRTDNRLALRTALAHGRVAAARALIRHDPNALDEVMWENGSPLVYVCRSRRLAAVRFVLEECGYDRDLDRALIVACMCSTPDVVNALLARGARVAYRQWGAFRQACMRGNLSAARAVAGAMDARDIALAVAGPDTHTLHGVCAGGHARVLEWLLVSISFENVTSRVARACMCAAARGGYVRTTKVLMSASPVFADAAADALDAACRAAQARVVQLLCTENHAPLQSRGWRWVRQMCETHTCLCGDCRGHTIIKNGLHRARVQHRQIDTLRTLVALFTQHRVPFDVVECVRALRAACRRGHHIIAEATYTILQHQRVDISAHVSLYEICIDAHATIGCDANGDNKHSNSREWAEGVFFAHTGQHARDTPDYYERVADIAILQNNYSVLLDIDREIKGRVCNDTAPKCVIPIEDARCVIVADGVRVCPSVVVEACVLGCADWRKIANTCLAQPLSVDDLTCIVRNAHALTDIGWAVAYITQTGHATAVACAVSSGDVSTDTALRDFYRVCFVECCVRGGVEMSRAFATYATWEDAAAALVRIASLHRTLRASASDAAVPSLVKMLENVQDPVAVLKSVLVAACESRHYIIAHTVMERFASFITPHVIDACVVALCNERSEYAGAWVLYVLHVLPDSSAGVSRAFSVACTHAAWDVVETLLRVYPTCVDTAGLREAIVACAREVFAHGTAPTARAHARTFRALWDFAPCTVRRAAGARLAETAVAAHNEHAADGRAIAAQVFDVFPHACWGILFRKADIDDVLHACGCATCNLTLQGTPAAHSSPDTKRAIADAFMCTWKTESNVCVVCGEDTHMHSDCNHAYCEICFVAYVWDYRGTRCAVCRQPFSIYRDNII